MRREVESKNSGFMIGKTKKMGKEVLVWLSIIFLALGLFLKSNAISTSGAIIYAVSILVGLWELIFFCLKIKRKGLNTQGGKK